MKYYIYETSMYGPHRTMVHSGDCSWCNEGTGTSNGTYDPKYAEWHGPYATMEEARGISAKLKDVVESGVHNCV